VSNRVDGCVGMPTSSKTQIARWVQQDGVRLHYKYMLLLGSNLSKAEINPYRAILKRRENQKKKKKKKVERRGALIEIQMSGMSGKCFEKHRDHSPLGRKPGQGIPVSTYNVLAQSCNSSHTLIDPKIP
jgi:hypothetical protein